MTGAPWPRSLTFHRRQRTLAIRFDDGTQATLTYKALRENSPSAEVQGHGGGPKPPQAPVPKDIDILAADPVGRYAVRLRFSDGHETGLYSWSLLHGLAAGAHL